MFGYKKSGLKSAIEVLGYRITRYKPARSESFTSSCNTFESS